MPHPPLNSRRAEARPGTTPADAPPEVSPAKASPPGAPLIELRGIGIALAGRVLLQDVDLEVHRAEIVTVIGPNGGGKTTLLRILLGLVAPDSGRVRSAPGIAVGYVPQRMHIDPVLPLSVARLLATPHRRSRDELTRAAALTGTADLLDRPAHSLSGGEFQRVLLARALLARPDLLVLDEPLQGVDFAGEAALYELIGKVRTLYGCGVLLVSHDLHIVMAATDRVVCLNRHVCCTGAPREVARHSEYLRLFGPRGDQAYALYEHRHDHDHDLQGNVLEPPDARDGPS